MTGSTRRWSGLLVLACAVLICVQISVADDAKTTADSAAAENTAEQSVDEKAKPEWKSLFDGQTLDGWQETNFGAGGEVLVEDGQLKLSFGDGCTGVTWQKEFPKVNYEVRLQAQRVVGTDFFCGMTFPVENSPCSLIVGGWGGALVGLSSIDDQDAANNHTKLYMTFKKGQWYNIRLRVTKTRITVWIDEKPVIDQVTTGHKLSIRPEVAKSKPFGLCSWSTSAALRQIELRNLTDEEAAQVDAESPQVEAAAKAKAAQDAAE